MGEVLHMTVPSAPVLGVTKKDSRAFGAAALSIQFFDGLTKIDITFEYDEGQS